MQSQRPICEYARFSDSGPGDPGASKTGAKLAPWTEGSTRGCTDDSSDRSASVRYMSTSSALTVVRLPREAFFQGTRIIMGTWTASSVSVFLDHSLSSPS